MVAFFEGRVADVGLAVLAPVFGLWSRLVLCLEGKGSGTLLLISSTLTFLRRGRRDAGWGAAFRKER